MAKLVLEVGMKLDKSVIYYHEILTSHGLRLIFSCIIHDIYYTNKDDLNGLTENEIKRACVRIRYCNGFNQKQKSERDLEKKEKELIKKGYHKVFDTIKMDFQYGNDKMESCIQIQDIKDIGLLVYYDNSKYYEYPQDDQRKMLLDELNSYGFEFKESDMGLDKLRTLYYGKEMFSKNQNA